MKKQKECFLRMDLIIPDKKSKIDETNHYYIKKMIFSKFIL